MVEVSGNICWICGTNQHMTSHHAIPQHLKPKLNIAIPVCVNCHKKINSDDVGGMYAYIYKLEKLLQSAAGHTRVLKNTFLSYTKNENTVPTVSNVQNKAKIIQARK